MACFCSDQPCPQAAPQPQFKRILGKDSVPRVHVFLSDSFICTTLQGTAFNYSKVLSC